MQNSVLETLLVVDYMTEIYYFYSHNSLHDKKAYPKKIRVYCKLKNFECDDCGKICKTKQKIEQHIEIHLTRKKYKCGICQNKYKTKNGLVQHKLVHRDRGRFECRKCGKKFSKNWNLKVHIKRYHDDQKTKIFTPKQKSKNLTTSDLRNFSEKFECDRCGRFFRRKLSMFNHFRDFCGSVMINRCI
jgi:KRAB domain-containing zinc finger protein